MEVFRISKSKYIDDLMGTGARLHGGRWNRIGVPVLYTSTMLPLALLELIVNFTGKNAFKLNYSYLKMEVPDKLIVDISQEIDVEGDRNDYPKLNKIAEGHFFEGNVLAIKVPSFVLPQEHNLIINPMHQNFGKVQILMKDEIRLDQRLKTKQQPKTT